jgi:hypothetical protein
MFIKNLHDKTTNNRGKQIHDFFPENSYDSCTNFQQHGVYPTFTPYSERQ